MNVPELGVPVGMLVALQGLGVGLQAVAGLVQQPLHQRRRRPMALPTQLVGQRAQRLAGPAQRRHRITPRLRLDQRIQRLDQARVQFLGPFAAPARGAGAAHLQGLRVIQLVPAPPHVSGDTSTAAATIRTPPLPSSRASAPSQTLRCRSVRCGLTAS